VIIYVYLWFGASAVAVVAGCIGAHSNHKLATAPYVMDLEAAEHRRWQTMHPAHHRAPGYGTNELYVPRHGFVFDEIVASLNWVEAAA